MTINRAGTPEMLISVYYDEDDGVWYAEIADDSGDFVGIAIAASKQDAYDKANGMIQEARSE